MQSKLNFINKNNIYLYSLYFIKKKKIIYVVRNPKDVSVSYFHFAKLNTQSGYKDDFKKFANLFLEGKGDSLISIYF
jgi:hypothetical protein